MFELAVRSSGGDLDALHDLIEQCRSPLFAQAYADLRHYEDAQDAVAAALLRVCQHIHELKDPGRVQAWMAAILRNESRRLRRRPRITVSFDEERDEPEHSTSEGTLRLDVERALRLLPVDQARALELHYLRGYPVSAVAETLQRPTATIKTWLHRGRHQLARHLEGYMPGSTACIMSCEIEAGELENIRQALQKAGYSSVLHLSGVEEGFSSRETQEGGKEIVPGELLMKSDLIVLDNMLDGYSAGDVIRLLRAAETTRAIPVAMLTPRCTDLQVMVGWMAGFDLFLTRPVKADELSRLAGVLRQRAA